MHTCIYIIYIYPELSKYLFKIVDAFILSDLFKSTIAMVSDIVGYRGQTSVRICKNKAHYGI